jgi:hypothetical protein
MTFKEDLPLSVDKRRNAKEDMARLINLMHELLQEQKRTNELLLDYIGVPPAPNVNPNRDLIGPGTRNEDIKQSGDTLTPEQFEAMDNSFKKWANEESGVRL